MSAPLPDAVELGTPKLRLGLIAAVVLAGAAMIAAAAIVVNEPVLWLVVVAEVALAGFFLFGLLRGVGVSLDRDGFTVRGMFGEQRRNWADVSEFRIGHAGKARVIRFNDVTKAGVISDMQSASGRGNSRISPLVVAGGLQRACDMLNAFRERALRR